MGGLHYNESNFIDDAPPGTIALWQGSESTIPVGWAKCDGTNGTHNLLGRLIVGAGGAYAVGDTGGSETTSHAHPFDIVTGNPSQSWRAATLAAYNNESSSSPHQHRLQGTSTTATTNNIPPSHALYFIMKL